MAENQNINEWKRFGNVIPTLMDRVSQFQTFQSEARAKKQIENIEASNRAKQDLYISWLNTEDHWVAKSCNRAIKLTQVADWIRDFYKDQVDFSDSYWTDSNVIKTYIDSNPSSWPYLKAYVTDDEDTTCNPTQLYRTMGWSMSQWEEKTESALKNILKNFEAPFRITGKWVRNWMQAFKNIWYDIADYTWLDDLLWRNAKEEKMWNSRDEALREYALDHYTDYWLYLTEEDWQNAMDDFLKDPSILNKYIDSQNLLNSTVETVGWWTWAAAEMWWFWWIPALINWWISVWVETPVVKEILSIPLGALWLLAEWIWFLMDEVPADGSIADRVWKSLDDESKKLIEYYWAGKIAATSLTTRDPKTWKISIRPTVKNAAKNIAWWFSDWYNWLRNFKKNKATNKANAKNTELLEWLANRIWQWETKDISSSVKALQSIWKWVDTKKVKTFKDLREAWRTREKQLVDKVDENLSNKDFKIKLSDQKPTMIWWEEKGKVIDDAINDLIDVYSQQRKWSEVERIQNLKNDLEEWVDPKTFNDFIREYWTELNAWNKKNELTTNTKKWWEETRDWMKDLLRERIPESEFQALDREMSDVINFNRLVDSTVEKVNNITKRLRKEWLWNKTMWRIVEWWIDLLDMLTGKWVSKAVAKRVLWTKSAWNLVDFAELEKELPKLLKSFDNINQELNKSKWFLETNETLNNAVNELDALVKEIKNTNP